MQQKPHISAGPSERKYAIKLYVAFDRRSDRILTVCTLKQALSVWEMQGNVDLREYLLARKRGLCEKIPNNRFSQ